MCLRYAIKSFFLCALLAVTAVSTADSSTDPYSVHISLLAKRGPAHCRTIWNPTADYLSKTVKPYYSAIVPLDFTSVAKAVAEKECDPNKQQSLGAFFRQYKKGFLFFGIAFIVICFSAVCVARLNAKLSVMNSELRETQRNLESALIAANDANRSKDEFLANMSHELRTPMNGIIGMTSILLNTDLADEQAEFAQIIMKSAENLMSIINDILDYSHIHICNAKLDVVDFDLVSLVNDVVDKFSSKAKEKGLVFSHNVADNVPTLLRGDVRRIEKVIRILLSNAVKFTHQGAVSFQVALAENGNSHSTLRFDVKDTGIGIDPESKNPIFSPFCQADNSSTRRYSGTGLGLALAKHFAEMMGGHIGIESMPANGSTFRFSVQVKKQPRINTAAPTAQPAFDASLTCGPKVLVVEDNPINQKVMLKILNTHGCRTQVVDNGRKAVLELCNNAYDVVLMDLQMPEMNGFEATGAIRNPLNKCINPQVPIIAVTANTMKEDRKKCLDAGMDDFFPKPVNPNALMEKVRQWYEKQRQDQRSKSSIPN